MNKLGEIFEKNKGFARMKEMREAGVQTRDIAKAVAEGIVEKIKPGLYKLSGYPFDENESFATVCNADNKAVICLLSAASFYELTTFIPSEVYVALPMNTPRFNISYPPFKIYYFRNNKYELGIDEKKTGSGIIKIYTIEKTIVDLFRYMNKLGEDIALESLKTYMRNKNNKPGLLADIALKLGAYKKMEPYMKGAM